MFRNSRQVVISIFVQHRPGQKKLSFQKYFTWLRSDLLRPNPSLLNICRRTHPSNFDEGKGEGRYESGEEERDDYEMICPITDSYFGQVITHMRNNFFVDEPTQQMLGMYVRGEPIPILEKICLEALAEDLSLMFIHIPTNQVAALAINGIFVPSDIITDSNVQIDDEGIRMVFNIFADIHRCLNLFEKYGVDKIFDIKTVSVDENHRRKGLAKAVIEKSLEIAEGCGCKVVKTEGTSKFTQQAFARSGFKTEWERNYTAFICENGDPVFQPIDPHRNLKVMTKILNIDE